MIKENLVPVKPTEFDLVEPFFLSFLQYTTQKFQAQCLKANKENVIDSLNDKSVPSRQRL